jgi:hypothetical protein
MELGAEGQLFLRKAELKPTLANGAAKGALKSWLRHRGSLSAACQRLNDIRVDWTMTSR